MKKQLLLFLSLFSLVYQTATAQEPCATDTLMSMLLSQSPEYVDAREQFELNYQTQPQFRVIPEDVMEIPVVFHIMHNGGPENISDEQVHNALHQANEQLRGYEGGIDTRIQLRLAKLDPDGLCTTGITRNQIPVPDVNLCSLEADEAFKDQIRWSVEHYLNVWVVRCIVCNSTECNSSGINGYAFIPPIDNANSDGVVIKHSSLGTIGTAVENEQNAFVHEVGHYLGLFHLHGTDYLINEPPCINYCHDDSDCLELGDRVCDTGQTYANPITSICTPTLSGSRYIYHNRRWCFP